ncbi:transcriptional adapter ADA2-like isoform X1 [Pistacia vera]|uniref:transcriptional adapter ADA2-like isoform X1 n=1 Tax=Pistacia vera TaxID=55513 RepID=UPI001262AEDC|nr:transcriptional adapter ADA2-like isoform X1 [Pistacia vera]XP_031264775.1 transcriptional adapter ADA2-like isoform X1 [Pistacia vera]
MGRSRAVSHYADDDHNQNRSKRKRTISSLENIETASTGQPFSEGKGALYHCNYCNKDISGFVRIKCALCSDFDLCIECFSVGAEITPHKSNHPYRVMDNLSFPLICPDWNADEEILLLEGIEMYGFGNWAEVAEHVGTKSKSQCIDHYNAIYLSSPCFPLPDLSHVMGKSREELLAMAKGHGEVKKELTTVGEVTMNEESSFSPRVKSETLKKEDPAHQSSSSLTIEAGSHMHSSSSNTFSSTVKKALNIPQIKDSIKAEEPLSDRSIGEKKPRVAGDEKPSMTELSGYNFKRQEFEVEYDNDAEQLLADMEFKDTDTDAERELKLRVLRIYSKRLDERKRRKDFIVERNLLYLDPFEKDLSPEEKEIYQRFKVFMRFHSKEDHEELLKSIIEEHRIVKRIQDLQEALAAGFHTSAEANKFLEQKRRKEAEENAQRVKSSSQAGPSGKVLQRPNSLKGEVDVSPCGVVRGSMALQPFGNVSPSTMASSLDDWDISGFVGASLLSETEKQLCGEIRILPSHYLKMLEILSVEVMKGNISKKSDAHDLFKVEASKVDRVYDMLVKKGIAKA